MIKHSLGSLYVGHKTMPRNNQSLMQLFSGFDSLLRGLLLERPKAWLIEARAKLKDLPATNAELGRDFAARGLLKDAVFRFRVALYLRPHFPQVYYHLGCCQLRLGQRAQARQSFLTALKQQPGDANTLFMLALVDPSALLPEQQPQQMPPGMVQPFFAGLAAEYDAIEAQNQYQGAQAAYDAAKALLPASGLHVLDLGAGSGLASRPWRAAATEIVGVDFVPAMVEVARQVRVAGTPLFQQVHQEDITRLSATVPAAKTADLVLAVNVLQFIGNLQPFFAGLVPHLKAGAKLVVTIEPLAAGHGFAVNPATGRFGHHPDYVKQQAAQAGLALKHESRVPLYPDFTAHQFVFET